MSDGVDGNVHPWMVRPTLTLDPNRSIHYAELAYRARCAAYPELVSLQLMSPWDELTPEAQAGHIADMRIFIDALANEA